MRRGERIPLHTHEDEDSGGPIDRSNTSLSTLGTEGIGASDPGGSGSGGSGSSTTDPIIVVEYDGLTPLVFNFELAKRYDVLLLDDVADYSFSNPPADGQWGEMTVVWRQGTGAPFTVTHPAEVQWPDTDGTDGGAAPTLFVDEDARDVHRYVTEDGGVTFGGSYDSASSGGASGAAGGDLSGTYPNPSVVDDSHNHTAATLPAVSSGGSAGHVHVTEEVHLSDGSTTTFTLDAYYEPGSIQAWNRTAIARLLVTEVLPDQVTVSAAGTTGDQLIFDYAATLL